MRHVRYNVVTTLDGYIAGPHGEFDWIPNEPAIDFASIFANVDTVLLGGGIQFLPPSLSERVARTFVGAHEYPSGLIILNHRISNAEGA